MRNLINESPMDPLRGRTQYAMDFVSELDISNKDVLDIGCGYGWFEVNAVKKGVKRIVGIEISVNDITTAKENITDDVVNLAIGTGTSLPFANNRFDTVVSWEVLEHIPNQAERRLFGEVFRVLKPGGVFYLSVPYDHVISKVLDPAWWLMNHRHYSKSKIFEYAQDSGFYINQYSLKGGLVDIINTNNIYISKWIFRRRPFLEKSFLRRINIEYEMDDGYNTIFLKLRKNMLRD